MINQGNLIEALTKAYKETVLEEHTDYQSFQHSIDRKMYERDLKAYVAFAGSVDTSLDSATLARWRAYLSSNTDMSPNTINRMISAVKRLMKEAAIQGYIGHETALDFKHVEGVRVSALKERTKTTARHYVLDELEVGLTDNLY